jgi:hypothetical protein
MTIEEDFQESAGPEEGDKQTEVERPIPPRMKSPSKLNGMMQTTGRLSINDLHFGIPTNQGAQAHVDEHHGEESWRARILKLLHQTKVQLFLMGLLFLDVVILFVEIFLLASYPPCNIIERDCIPCCEAEGNDHFRVLVTEESDPEYDEHGDNHAICEAGYEPDQGEAACDSHKWQRVHTAETVLFSLTITILSVFLVELHLEMIALGPTVFFRQFFYTLDYIIVAVSITLELFFRFSDEEAVQSLVGLLVFFRVWRFVRIGHGIIEITSELTHHPYQELLQYAESLEATMHEHDLPLPDASKTIQRGQSGSAQH